MDVNFQYLDNFTTVNKCKRWKLEKYWKDTSSLYISNMVKSSILWKVWFLNYSEWQRNDWGKQETSGKSRTKLLRRVLDEFCIKKKRRMQSQHSSWNKIDIDDSPNLTENPLTGQNVKHIQPSFLSPDRQHI